MEKRKKPGRVAQGMGPPGWPGGILEQLGSERGSDRWGGKQGSPQVGWRRGTGTAVRSGPQAAGEANGSENLNCSEGSE